MRFALVLAAVVGVSVAAADAPSKRMNVLFLAADDMRPQLGCYGDAVVKSPNIDRLAGRGVVFNRAYCQQALCSPSRISLLSGRYPSTTRIYQIGPALRETMPDIVTLPQHFKNNGYFTRSLGKIYHVGIDDPASWSVPSYQPKAPRLGPIGREGVQKVRQEAKKSGRKLPVKGKGAANFGTPPFESPDVADDGLADGDIANTAVASLHEFAQKPGQPFFLGCGFLNPHVPWVAPKRYWDLYRSEDLKLPDNQYVPRGAPVYAAKSGDDFYWYAGVPADRHIGPEYGRDCLHGYLAAISYVDAQVGKVLAALEKEGLAENTVVFFWGDHGYYMGEHSWWGGKHNNYEGATRCALIASVPGMKAAGRRTDGIVEFVDMYPTMVELCGLPAPVGTQGASFKGLLEEPEGRGKERAFSWYPKGGYLGRTMRTERWRYVEWADKEGKIAAVELYDHQSDPEENQNVADRGENKGVVDELHKQMHADRVAEGK